MEFRVLGPLEIYDQDQMLALGQPRTRAVCALLLVRPGSLVNVEQFIDELWPDRPPVDARALVRGYLSRLRRALRQGPSGSIGADRLVTHKPGYRIRVNDGELDLHRFERLVADARKARQAGQPQRCIELFGQAHQQWRGDPFADAPRTASIAAAAARLTELRLASLEEQFDAILAAGHDADNITELTALVAAHPLREQFVALLMLALYRKGRQADALQYYQHLRLLLADELGADPSQPLQDLYQRILRDDPALASSGRAIVRAAPGTAQMPVPHQLPARPPLFAGRTHELAQLTQTLDAGAHRPGTVVISAIGGAGGIGKTWLALRWAHDHLNQFPDGQLYVNLRGFDPSDQPVPPTVAVRNFLQALGAQPAAIPTELDAQAGLYRSIVANKRMLILLDNARDAEQVRPLLPGSADCAVVITSRNSLTSLIAAEGAYPLNLDLLTAAEARQLLAHRLGDDRVAAEPDAIDDIIARCARLPLALAIAAARATTQPNFSLTTLADQLRTAHDGDALDAFDGGDASTDIRAVFSWSYRALSAGAARLFRLLGLHPGPDISGPAAASLAGIPLRQTNLLLAELTRTNLLTERSPGRYTFHDLLHAYATDLVNTDGHDIGQQAALHRMLDYYLHTAHAAAKLLDPHRDPISLAPPQPQICAETLADYGHALAWHTTEHPVLLGLVEVTDRSGLDQHTWQLAWALDTFFDRRQNWQGWSTTQTVALRAAQRLSHRDWQAHSHRALARATIQIGRYDAAHNHLQQALDLYAELNDEVGQAHTHLLFSWLNDALGRHREALHHDQLCLTLYQAARHQSGQANALNNIGWHHSQLSEYQEALTHSLQALALQQEIGNRVGESTAWDSVGYVHQQLGDYQQAADCYRHSIKLAHELGHRLSAAEALTHLGDAHHATSNPDGARQAWQEALNILKELDHPNAEDVRVKLRTLDLDLGGHSKI
ncbi:BTAD domain-containing putative transcriptional regulator [Dactylosporangium sp. NPDC005572]|uniref:AfsR/SARP family transcriptional regulator n=1 Tax=Dactylosporangium sp. NPDC005572 TaxID=3156889 RepID=UPI0033A45458